MDTHLQAILWVAAAAIVFGALVFKQAKAGIVGLLDGHRNKIAAALNEAETLRNEAMALRQHYEIKLTQAASESEAIIQEAKEDARILRSRADEALAQDIARRRKQALEKIEAAEANAIKDVRSLATDIALSATRAILIEQLKGEDASKLIDQTLDALPKTLAA